MGTATMRRSKSCQLVRPYPKIAARPLPGLADDNVLKNAEVTLEDPVLHTEATLGPDAVFYSSFNVTGLDGTDLGTSIGGNSAALKHDDQTEAYWGPPIQLIGCSLSVRNHTVIVEPQSKLPVDFDINVDKFALDWEDWEPLMVRKGNVADAVSPLPK